MTIMVNLVTGRIVYVGWRQGHGCTDGLCPKLAHAGCRSGLKPIEGIADSLTRHREGILAWYNCRISNGKLESINNKSSL